VRNVVRSPWRDVRKVANQLVSREGAISMSTSRTFRIGLSTLLVAAGVVAGGALNLAGATSKQAPQLVVRPSGSLGGLHNKQIVKVRGQHFKAHDQLYLVECLAKASGSSGCDTSTATPVTVSAKGTFGWTNFQVHTGTIGTGTCGTSKTNLKACAISAGNATGGDTAAFRITFALPKKK
jgi:Neocarzinostatin family